MKNTTTEMHANAKRWEDSSHGFEDRSSKSHEALSMAIQWEVDADICERLDRIIEILERASRPIEITDDEVEQRTPLNPCRCGKEHPGTWLEEPRGWVCLSCANFIAEERLKMAGTQPEPERTDGMGDALRAQAAQAVLRAEPEGVKPQSTEPGIAVCAVHLRAHCKAQDRIVLIGASNIRPCALCGVNVTTFLIETPADRVGQFNPEGS